jgi:hypothetical protein
MKKKERITEVLKHNGWDRSLACFPNKDPHKFRWVWTHPRQACCLIVDHKSFRHVKDKTVIFEQMGVKGIPLAQHLAEYFQTSRFQVQFISQDG